MSRPCKYLHVQPDPTTCRMCWLELYRPDYWQKHANKVVMPGPNRPMCIYLGKAQEEDCIGGCIHPAVPEEVPRYDCSIYGTCTLWWPGAAVGCCDRCQNYVPMNEG